MPGPHYALSEALIVLAALWAVAGLARARHWLAAAGMAIFGIAATIGIYRFGLGRIEELADFHRAFSQIGGAIAMSLVAAGLMRAGSLLAAKGAHAAALLALAAASVGVMLMPVLAVPLFLGWLVAAMVGAAMLPAATRGERVLRVAIVGLFAVNLLAVRQSPHLDPAVSWHLFHVLVAVWVVGVAWILARTDRA